MALRDGAFAGFTYLHGDHIGSVSLTTDAGGNVVSQQRYAPYGEVRWTPYNIAARNPVFDVTPAELVTALITEQGVVHAPDAGKIGKLMEEKPT